MDRQQLPRRGPVHVGQYPDSIKKLETVQIILYKDIEVTMIVACKTGREQALILYSSNVIGVFALYFILTLHTFNVLVSTCTMLHF